MGRDGLLFWLFSFFSCYYLFKPYLTKKSKKLIKNVFIIVGSFAVVVFIMISIDRFGSDSNSEISTIDSVINYNGQAIDNFGRLYDSYTPESPVFSKLFELFGERDKLRGLEAVRRAEEFEFRFGFRSNIFSSFVGSFYSALGSICTILISFIYSLFIGRMLDKKNVNMNTLIILMISTQIVLHNYYYWAYYIRVANFFILTIPLICLYFSQTNKRS
jgi:oligosaccharide repeat unit polymerase